LFDSSVFDGEASDVIRLQLGELEITDVITIDGSGANIVITADSLGDDIFDPTTFVTDVEASVLAGSLADNHRVFSISTAVGETVSISDLTITGGNANGGGGIFTSSTTLELTNTDVSGNFSSGAGGGILTDQALTLNDSSVTGNASDTSGGGISAASRSVTLNNSSVDNNLGGGISTTSGDIAVNNSSVSENNNDGATDGGGISTTSGDVFLNASTVDNNESSSQGGGISTVTGMITVENSTISGNQAAQSGGGFFTSTGDVSVNESSITENNTTGDSAVGGAIATDSGRVTITDSAFSGNSTAGLNADGGAIASNLGSITVSTSTFSANNTLGTSSSGGAIATESGNLSISNSTLNANSTSLTESDGGAIATNSGNITVDSSTISGNSTASRSANGGGIFTLTGDISLLNSTITANSTGAIAGGGGIIIEGTSSTQSLTIQNSIVAGNTAGFNNDLQFNLSGLVDITFSLIGDNSGTSLVAASTPDANGNLIGSSNAVIDPLLGALSDNGGVTSTHAPLPGSPVIDAGGGSTSALHDQRGLPFVRNAGNSTDIGAFEFQTLFLTVNTPSDISDGSFSTLSLREAIDLANTNSGEDVIRFAPNQFEGSVFDVIHLRLGELTITESVTIDGEDLAVVISGDANRDDVNPSSSSGITDLDASSEFRLDDNSRVFNIVAPAGEVITLSGLTITGGIGANGGGIANQAADLLIERSTIAGNRALASGGGVFSNSGSVTLANSTVTGNESTGNAASGGGIHTNSGAISLTASTVSGNRSLGFLSNGGGISTDAGEVTLESVTITENTTVGDGGGVFISDSNVNPSLTIQNTIIAANEAAAGPDLHFDSDGLTDISFSLIGNNSGTNLAAAAVGSPDINGNFIGTSFAAIDPLLGDLADNSGPTFTHEPLPSSPAINNGSSTIATDQRGTPLLPRNDGAGVDIGSFERLIFDLVVDTSSDANNGDFSSGNLSLREALAISNINPAADTITFDAGVFNGEAADVIRLRDGALIISDGVTIDTGLADVVISGDATGDDVLVTDSFITDGQASENQGTLDDNVRAFDIIAASGELVAITGLTITGGVTSTSFDDGAGIANQDSDLSLTRVTISGNRANGFGADGGGIYTEDGSITLLESTINNNFSGAEGGGIYTEDGAITLLESTINNNTSERSGGGIYSNDGDIVLNQSYILDNFSESNGGGIHSRGDSFTLNDSQVNNNSTGRSGNGAGIYVSGTDITLNQSVVQNNTTGESGDGGGIFSSSGDVTLNESTISGNQSGDDGGGIRISSGDLTANNSTISGNQSGNEGGGIYSSSNDIRFLNSTISGNQSGGTGGGIYQRFGDLLHLFSSTVTNNRSEGDGGGIHYDTTSSSDSLRIENSIVAANITSDGIGSDLVYESGPTVTINYSVLGSNAGTLLAASPVGTPDANGNWIGTDTALVDPRLGPLADNGGPTLTHRLLSGSPAVDAGNPNYDQSGPDGFIGTPDDIVNDQRGATRILDGRVDIGAVEDTAILVGDVNLDGAVNFLDILPFISRQAGVEFQEEADINLDGFVNFLDIVPFIRLLTRQ